MKLLVILFVLLLSSCSAQQDEAVFATLSGSTPASENEPKAANGTELTVKNGHKNGHKKSAKKPTDDVAKNIAEQMFNVSALFVVPKQLNVDELSSATLTIDPTKTIADIIESETESTHVKKQDIEITRIAIAQLIVSPTVGLIVRETQTAKQVIRPDAATTWEWELVPLEAGEYKLIATVEAVVHVGIESAPMKQLKFNDTVTITVTKQQIVERWIHTHIDPILGWFWTVLIVPVFLYIRKKFFSKK